MLHFGGWDSKEDTPSAHCITVSFPELPEVVSGIALDFPGLFVLGYFWVHVKDVFKKNPKIALV